jgi:hypothetical protein
VPSGPESPGYDMNASEELTMNDDTGGRRRLRRMRPPCPGRGRRPLRRRVISAQAGWLVLLVAAAALALAACSGTSNTPQVASLGTSSGPGSNTAPASGGATSSRSTSDNLPGNVTSLLNQWAVCERSNGDPQQAVPTVDANGVIYITIPQRAQYAGDIHDLTGTCTQYLAQAQNELRAANPVAPAPGNAEFLKWVNCVRANGVPDYPYPTGDTTNFQGSGVDPNSPLVARVSQLCGKKLGLPTWWVNGTPTPGALEVHTAGQSVNRTAPACFFQKVDPCSGEITKSPGSGSGNGPGAAVNG